MNDYINLRKRGIDEAAAAELRARLATFDDDWNDPDMDEYDNYEAEIVQLKAEAGAFDNSDVHDGRARTKID